MNKEVRSYFPDSYDLITFFAILAVFISLNTDYTEPYSLQTGPISDRTNDLIFQTENTSLVIK